MIFSLLCAYGFGQWNEAKHNFETGNKYFKQKDYQNAITYYSISLAFESAADAYFNRAMCYIHLKDTCKYCQDLESDVMKFHDKQAWKLYYTICAKKDSIIETSDSIKDEFPGYSYTILSKHHYDTLVSVCHFDNQNKEIFSKSEQMPEFPGGEEALHRFLAYNVQYPIQAMEDGIEGSVMSNFIIKSDGNISDIKILKGIGGGVMKNLSGL